MEAVKAFQFPFYLFDSVLPAWKDTFIRNVPLLITAERSSNHVLSYDDIFQLTKAFANGIRNAGLKPGDRLALWADPSIYEIVVCLGTIAAGGVFVALPQSMKDIDSKACLESCSPKFLLASPSHCEKAKVMQKNGRGFLTYEFDDLPLSETGTRSDATSGTTWRELLDSSAEQDLTWNDLGAMNRDVDRPVILFYTSGSTGPRKLVQISPRNLSTGLDIQVREYRKWTGGQHLFLDRANMPVMRFLADRGLSYVSGTRILHSVRAVSLGLPVQHHVVTKSYESVHPFLAFLSRSHITHARLSGYKMRDIAKLNADQADTLNGNYDFSHLMSVTTAGTYCSPNVFAAVQTFLRAQGATNRFVVRNSFGMSETVATITFTDPTLSAADQPAGFVGHLLPSMEAKVIPIDHLEQRCTGIGHIETDKAGEICLKGNAITKGYFGKENSTNGLFTEDGWMRTGDIGTVSDDGGICVWGRIRETFKLNSTTVCTTDQIEGTILGHPDVQDVAVVKVKPNSSNMSMTASQQRGIDASTRVFIVGGLQLTEQGILDFLSKELSCIIEMQGGLWFRDTLPKAATGKIMKHSLVGMDQLVV